jgi:hypothetical protein
LPHTRSVKNATYNVSNLSAWWGDKRLAEVTARNYRAYAEGKEPAAARRDLETLRVRSAANPALYFAATTLGSGFGSDNLIKRVAGWAFEKRKSHGSGDLAQLGAAHHPKVRAP